MAAVLESVFWLSAAGVVYGYVGYPLLLWVLARSRASTPRGAETPEPTVSMLVPVHNESHNVEAKLANTKALDYPAGRLEILFISDGSTDDTVARLRAGLDDRTSVIDLPERRGKASALNTGLMHARHDIVVFSDASIALEPRSIRKIVQPFRRSDIGCVSGEDRIASLGGEGLYGRYELFLRRLESDLHSIVGASGSFYAQRRSLCDPFPAGLAPDFLSVLRTVARGYRAVSEPEAVGTMAAVDDPDAEFSRKVRTLLRGMSTLFEHRALLNPLRYGWFAFELFSHKLVRWLIPLFLMAMIATSVLLSFVSAWYALAAALQIAFYVSAALAWAGTRGIARSMPGKVALYFTSANVATAVAWLKFLTGTRQEIWAPSRR